MGFLVNQCDSLYRHLKSKRNISTNIILNNILRIFKTCISIGSLIYDENVALALKGRGRVFLSFLFSLFFYGFCVFRLNLK